MEKKISTITPHEGGISRCLREDFNAEATLAELVKLIPEIESSQVKALREIIVDAQANIPSDKAGFVRKVNRLLTIFNLRIRADGHDLCRLCLSRGSSIQLTLSGRGVRGFKSARIELVRVPDNYGGCRLYTPRVEEIL